MTLRPAHRVADDNAAPGDRVLDDARRRSWPSCSIVQCFSSERADRPWLRWSSRPYLAAVGGALEVPAVDVERVAVREDHGQVVVGGGHAPKSSGSSISTWRSSASATTSEQAVELTEGHVLAGGTVAPAIDAVLSRRCPRRRRQRARPAAPTTVPKMRPLMLNGWSFRSPRCLPRCLPRCSPRCLLAVDVPADQPAADAGHDLVADRVDGVPQGTWAVGSPRSPVAKRTTSVPASGSRRGGRRRAGPCTRGRGSAAGSRRPRRGRCCRRRAAPPRGRRPADADGGVLGGVPGVPVGDALTGPDDLAHPPAGTHRHGGPRPRRGLTPGAGSRP